MEKKFLWIALLFLLVFQSFQPFGNKGIIAISLIEVLLVLVLGFRMPKKWQSINKEGLNSNKRCNQQIVDLMKIYRHDWLNHLQVILGYVSLKKTDQIFSYVNKVNQEAKQRSIISNFENVDVSAFLYMLPILYPKLRVELEVNEQVKLSDQDINSHFFIHTIKSYIESFNNNVQEEIGTGTLILAMAMTEQDFIITFEYEGEVTQILKKDILNLSDQVNTEHVNFELILADEAELIMELTFPLTKK